MVTAGPLRIVYFGTPEFAVPSLRRLMDSRHPVIALVSQPDRPKGRGQKLTPTPTKLAAMDRGVPVLQPERIRDEGFLSAMRDLRPDLGVVAAYGKILPDALIAIPRLGMINVHASLLPAYRGAAPVHRAVINGDRVTGVTIMRVVKELDAGPMFLKGEIPIRPDDTSVDVERALSELGASLLLQTVEDLAAGSAVETPQDDALATLAPKIRKEEGLLDWTLDAHAIHNRVRGLQPWPLVSTSLDGIRVILHRTSVTGERSEASPGTIVHAAGDRLDVAAGDGGVLRIDRIQLEGKRVMTAREFLSGHRLAAGARFGSS